MSYSVLTCSLEEDEGNTNEECERIHCVTLRGRCFSAENYFKLLAIGFLLYTYMYDVSVILLSSMTF